MTWTIVDGETGKEVTVAAFFSREQAEDQIERWIERGLRGGRKDISIEKLLRMEAKEVVR